MVDVYKKWLLELKKKRNITEIKEGILYKGFIFIERDGKFGLYQYERNGEGHKEVDQKNINILMDLGFIKGADTIVYRKDLKRISYHKKAIEELTKIKEKFNEEKHIQGIFANDNKKNLQHVLKNHVDAYYELKIRINNYKKKWK